MKPETLGQARDILQWLYRLGAVTREAEGAFRELQAAVAQRDLARVQDQDWCTNDDDDEGVPTTTSLPQREPVVLTPDQDMRLRDLVGEYRESLLGGPRSTPWSDGPVRHAISDAIESLPHGHPLEAPLMRADDARSEHMVLWRWARALAWYWGVDAEAYTACISRHPLTAQFEMDKRSRMR